MRNEISLSTILLSPLLLLLFLLELLPKNLQLASIASYAEFLFEQYVYCIQCVSLDSDSLVSLA